ncbi:3-deoxy-manno-octulosonate cytidylyltransferase [Pseudobythopirellula maris]|uniref:3-deoxy-manno-octulosonate cytidylyltransferase n=1 Tax=Pseudobythopirellula maris TaxID=2527991 RepID=A0A5C5ZS51_9BACT|nr:3-deoxy-manno-octulosonate cytidylyltransferase [Pseudobythopirellula maris]TWT90319.1 3-deoxy-manno-octulosonate cytidylyltransferase [Pseudobythopirellula maris]
MDASHRTEVPVSLSLPSQGACVVIPARLESTRLPRKMLLNETGRSIIQHTYEVALQAERSSAVVVATDHPEIEREVLAFGGRCVMTSPDCQSGADRVAEAARSLPGFDLFVNLQGDEPEFDPRSVDLLIDQMLADPSCPMGTVAAPLSDPERIADPSVVKVVLDSAGRALYFSRSPIPYARDPQPGDEPSCLQHLGLYAYRRAFLERLGDLPPSRLEQTEKLEQLRVLEAGETIRVGLVDKATGGIDTPADYAAFVARCSSRRAAA